MKSVLRYGLSCCCWRRITATLSPRSSFSRMSGMGRLSPRLRGLCELRDLLGDKARQPKIIKTVTGRGYRFLPPVTVQLATPEPVSVAEPTPARPRKDFPSPPLRVGILHSTKGMMARTETPVAEATVLAIEEINHRGGVGGREIKHEVVNCFSDETVFAREAKRLITTSKVSALFGCWTSASRKAVLPVVEDHDHLLFYPVQYEDWRRLGTLSTPARRPTNRSYPPSSGHSAGYPSNGSFSSAGTRSIRRWPMRSFATKWRH